MDIEAFMGFNILMGINSLPSLAIYWGNDSIHHYAPIADYTVKNGGSRYTFAVVFWDIFIMLV